MIPVGLVLLISWACSKVQQSSNNTVIYKPGDRVPPTVDPTVDFDSDRFTHYNSSIFPLTFCWAPQYPHLTSKGAFIARKVQDSTDTNVYPKKLANEEAVNNILNNNSTVGGRSVFGCTIFQDIYFPRDTSDLINAKFSYKIKSDEVQTISSWPLKLSPGPLESPKTRQLHEFQYRMNEAYLGRLQTLLKLTPTYSDRIISQRIPYPSYVATSSSRIVDVLPTFLVYCYIVISAFFVNRISTEKCNQSREMLKMCGLNDAVYWISTIIFNFACFCLVSLIILTFVKIPIFNNYSLWANSSFFLIFFFLIIFSIQQMLIGMIVCVICSKPSICTTVAVIVFIFSLSLASTIEVKYQQYVAPLSRLRALAYLPNLAMVLATRLIAKFEGQTVGLTLETFAEPVNEFNNLTFQHIIISMVTSCVIYSIILWYLDNVWPWQPGVPKPFYFFFTLNYWSPQRKLSQINNNIQLMNCNHDDGNQSDLSSYIEISPSNRPLAIECCKLTKKFTSMFKNENKLAVSSIDLNIYHGEITCLLGHNGAGKTTTMNMITGMFAPTSGTIRVNGYDLIANTFSARKSMCLCPQHDPLYEELTVQQHLYLYACIKGFPLNQLDKEIEESLILTEMTEHCDKLPKELSGGMKRKLSLAIAVVGGSQILILDEPSSGLDTEARRSMWDALKRIRETRTILLTTHDMEEADALGDRIIIMSEGKIRCAGTPIFLKQKLGAGYTLTISKLSTFQPDDTLNLIHRYLPLAKVKSDFGSEIIYELGENAETKCYLGQFFNQLDDKKENLGIDSFGVSVATLEDVFLKVCDTATEDKSDQSIQEKGFESNTKDVNISLLDGRVSITRKTGLALIFIQFYSLIIKRLFNAKRSLKMVFYQLVLPCLIFGLAFFLTSRMRTIKTKLTAIQHYSLALYPETQIFVQSDGTKASESFISTLKFIVESQDHECVHVDANISMSDYFLSRMRGRLPSQYIKSHVFGFSARTRGSDNSRQIHLWINIEASHVLPVAVDLISRTHLLEILHAENYTLKNDTSSLLQTYGQPGSDRKEVIHIINKIGSATWIIFVPFSVTFLAASYVIFPISEKYSKAKLIQIMTGLHPMLLHFSSFIFDLATNLICSCLLLLFIYLIDTTHLFVPDMIHAMALLSLLTSFGAVSIVLAYIFSLLFSDDSKSFIVLNVIYLVSGIILGTIMYALEILNQLKLITRGTFNIVYTLAHITPIFSMTWGFKKIYDNNSVDQLCKSLGPDRVHFICNSISSRGQSSSASFSFGKGETADRIYDLFSPCCAKLCRNKLTGIDTCVHANPFGSHGNQIAPEIFYMLLTLSIYSFILYLLESVGRYFDRWIDNQVELPLNDEEVDIDVQSEEESVKQLIDKQGTEEKALTVYQLYKRYSSFFAVRGISFSVGKQECFGLLGVNGAGKSTTFGILTGDLTATRGRIIQENLDIVENRRLYQQNLGYCPQFNPIIDNMSGLEMIYLFARLRGVPNECLAQLSNEMINLVDLQNHALKPSGTYSGGNKRKLSIALAMIGNPRLVLLDEPTAGVDPAARRKIWSTLSYIRESLACSMILTSHSMSECEALCSRMAIMVKGRFLCLGSGQHLKFRYGQGYTITIKLKYDKATDEEYLQSIDSTVDEYIQRKSKVDQHDTVFVYRVDREEGSISRLFHAMEHIKNKLDLEDYTLSDTTLEQIFIQFARKNK